MTPEALAERVRAGEPRAVARALRFVDDRPPGTEDLLKALWPDTGKAWVLGVTGNPGAGKSTLCDRLIGEYRARGERVGVVAVDPTSPFSGGAILGDRVRMSRHVSDEGVFIRSLATRGQLGGLSRSTRDAVRVLDAAGYGVVIVETVGVGQDEIDIARTAHTTLIVMIPGLGDEVQAIKAGLLECADVFAVNKADREGADSTVRDLELMLSLGDKRILQLSKSVAHGTHGDADGFVDVRARRDGWVPPIVKCVSTRGEGLSDLLGALDRHRAWLDESPLGAQRRRDILEHEVRTALRDALVDTVLRDLATPLEGAIRAVHARTSDPYSAIEGLVAMFRGRRA